MQITCTQCRQAFIFAHEELAFYKKIGVCMPDNCPACRRRLRLSFRNFFHLYHRTCDLTGKKIISMYDKDVPFPVYEMHEWWSDKWDGLKYGLDVDGRKPFMEQVAGLHRAVPRMNIVNSQSENTDYCAFSFLSRNCYLIFGNVGNEDCAYGHIVWQSKDCFDCLYCYKCQFCYECTDCVQCHSTFFSRDCDNCSDSMFLVHCVGCSDCFGCVGLKNKRHHIFNEAHSPEEYERKIRELNRGNHRTVALARERVRQLTGSEIVKYYHGFGCENVAGDYLYNSKNVHEGYDLKNCEDCRHCATLDNFHDSQDCNFAAQHGQLAFNCLTSYGYNILSCQCCMTESSDLAYCDNCYSCKDCIGCVGLKQKRYCILNKQYPKEEYEKLRAGIVDRMTADGSWGAFFPHELSPFAYNETMAQEYFPLTKEEALAAGWRWKDQADATEQYLGPVIDVPDDIKDVDDAFTKSILRCEVTGKLYKLIPQELAFYRKMGVPPPRRCPDQRQRDRFAQRNPRKLWSRACAKCSKRIETTYAPDRQETVYCEDCYLKAAY